MNELTHLSLFSGIGGLDRAAESVPGNSRNGGNMERLTIHLRDGITRCTKVSTDLCYEHSNCFDCEMYRRMVDRLAAYEDTGLTPEEVVQMAQELRTMKETARVIPVIKMREEVPG